MNSILGAEQTWLFGILSVLIPVVAWRLLQSHQDKRPSSKQATALEEYSLLGPLALDGKVSPAPRTSTSDFHHREAEAARRTALYGTVQRGLALLRDLPDEVALPIAENFYRSATEAEARYREAKG